MKSATLLVLLVARLAHAAGEPDAPYDVVVVGLGPSGLGALSRLAALGYRVLGLEAKGRLGGRVDTREFGGGLVEFGAEWIHGENEVFKLARQHNVTILDTDWTPNFGSEGTPNFGSRGDLNETVVVGLFEYLYDLYYKGGESEDETIGQYFIDTFYQHIKDNPAIANDKDFCRNFLRMFELVLASLDATDSWHEISRKGDGLYDQVEGSQGWSWNRLGYRTLFDILLQKYQNGSGLPVDIRLNNEVTKIDWSEKTVVVRAGEHTYRAAAAIITVSLGVLKHDHVALFEPALPAGKARAIAALSIGVVDKICLHYEEIWWGEKKSMIFLWNDDDRSKIPKEDWWILDINSFSVPMSNDHVISLWITGRAARYMETLDIDVVKRKTKQLLEIFFRNSTRTVQDAKDIGRSTWYSDPHTRGSYSYRGLVTDALPAAAELLAAPLPAPGAAGTAPPPGPVPRLLFAGEATSAHHFSTVHGALESGWREADRFHSMRRSTA